MATNNLKTIIGLILLALGLTMMVNALQSFVSVSFPFNVVVGFVIILASLWLMGKKPKLP